MMVFGPKTEVTLQRLTETSASGTWTEAWTDVETISQAVERPFSENERLLYGRDVVVNMRKIYIGYSDIASASRAYLIPKSRIQIDSTSYDIESAELFTGPGKHYRVILRKVT